MEMCRKKGEMIQYGPHGTKDIHGMIGVEKDARAVWQPDVWRVSVSEPASDG